MIRPRHAVAPVLAGVIALAVGGCGTQSAKDAKTFTGAEGQIAKVVDDLQKAGEDRNGTKICRDLVTAELQQQLASNAGPKGCGEVVKNIVKDTDQTDLSTRSVTLDTADNTKASAVVRQKLNGKTHRDVTLAFQKQGGTWRIAQLPS